MVIRILLMACLGACTTPLAVEARIWTDSTGHYSVEADLVAANEEMVVLKKANHELVSVPIAKLSAADQAFVEGNEAAAPTRANLGQLQTWTLKSGLQVIGRVVGYDRRDITLQRRRGHLYVNDRRLNNLPEIYQPMVLQMVSHYERVPVPDQAALEKWMLQWKGDPKTYDVDGVKLELENGDEYLVPFFLFPSQELAILEPGWHRWLAALETAEAEAERQRQSFLVQSAAQAYQMDRQAQQQIALMQLDLLGVAAGITDLWEVLLVPPQGTYRSPISVVVPARDSLSAVQVALQNHPGYLPGPARRVNRNR